MPVYTEPARLSDVLKREFDPLYNRESVTLTGGSYLVGAVVMEGAGGTWSAWAAPAAGDPVPKVGVVLFETDASAADRPATLLLRGPAVVAESALVFDAGVDDAGRAAALAALADQGIVARKTV